MSTSGGSSGVFGLVNDLTKGGNVPTDVVDSHITKLQASVGLKSGTLQELSNRHLQELAVHSSSPADFIIKYNQASAENVRNLTPMMEVLRGIAGHEATKKYLASKASAPESSGYQALKEKLLKEVGSRVLLDQNPFSMPGPGVRSGPFSHRTFLSLDFSNTNQHRSQVGSLGCVPVTSQETAIVQDLLFCLIGISGIHIRPTFHKHEISFELDKKVDPSLRELLNRILPLCNHYSVIVRFIEKYSQLASGQVNQAFSGALAEVLKDYMVFVAQLETQNRLGHLSLNKIWSYIQPTMAAMSMMADLCLTIDANASRGGRTLSLLHEKCVAQASSSTEPIHKLTQSLVKAAAEPFFRILDCWIHRGSIHDPGKDFFVEDNEIIERTVLPLEYSDDYWERRYAIKSDQIPAFLHIHADMILRTGKYLNVIQQCDRSNKSEANRKRKKRVIILTNSTDVIDGVDGEDTMQESGEANDLSGGDLHYMDSPDGYLLPLEKAYVFASKTLLEMLVREKDLIGHLRSVRHYFLMDQGDFIVQFMDLCDNELLLNVDEIDPARLESLLELALRTSAVNSDPYKDNVRVEILPYDLIYQMCKILSIESESESDFKGPVNTAELTALEAMAFGYDVTWPISLVLNRKSLACYQMLFRHLFYCKHVERLLSNVWISTKGLKMVASDYMTSFALKQKMLHFMQNLEYHMTFEVLEPNWVDMITKIQSGKVTNVDQVLQIHSDFLMTCLNDCLLSNPQLLLTVKKLMGVCCEFCHYIQALTASGLETSMDGSWIDSTSNGGTSANWETFEEDVVKFDLRFTALLISLLDKISQLARDNYNERILNILHRLDFNGFYSKALDTFGSASTFGKV